MAPEDTSNNGLINLESVQPTLRPRLERFLKNFRFVTPVDEKKKTSEQRKYGASAYTVTFSLPDETTKTLAQTARKDCYKCNGTGIKDWRRRGTKARVCKCTFESLVVGSITPNKIAAGAINSVSFGE